MLFTVVSAHAQKGCTTGDCENGKGRFVFDNGDKYIGEFKYGQFHGRGNYYYANGNVYKGQWLSSKRHGYGTFLWKNGDSYIGEYKNHQRNGEGTYVFANGTEEKGIWEEGALVRKVFPNQVEMTLPFERDKNETKDTSSLIAITSAQSNQATFFRAKNVIDSSQKRTALIIGNANYRNVPLKNPINDAKGMAHVLNESGFDVYLFTNLEQKTFKKTVRDFGKTLRKKGGVGLVYYAGHGLQTQGRNYLLPIDAEIEKLQDIEFESIDLGRVLVELEYAENNMNILILDACRDNPYKGEFEKREQIGNTGLASVTIAPHNSFIAFATSPGSAAIDGKGDHGLYTQELIETLQESSLTLEEIFKRVRKNVRIKSNGKQIPWESSSIEEDFYFRY